MRISGPAGPVVSPDVLDHMTDALARRGPRLRATYLGEGIALGSRSLELSAGGAGAEPLTNEDGQIAAVSDDLILNHAQLRGELERSGHSLRTTRAAEVIPHLYEERGSSFAERLYGDVAAAVWDARHQEGVLARDPRGIKPLYYARSGNLLLFASELKSLLASGLVSTELDYEAIEIYLDMGFLFAPHTLLAGVFRLRPGHRLIVKSGGLRIEQFDIPPDAAQAPRGFDGHAAQLLAELEQATRIRMRDDVPVGALLSGGLDSSLMVALMARNTSKPVKTFSLGLAEERSSNELAMARFVADLFGAEHHELELSLLRDTVDLSELTWLLDEPIVDLSTLGLISLCELAGQHTEVMLSGQGADTFLAGLPMHRRAALAGAWARLPKPARRLGESALAHGSQRLKRVGRVLAAPDPVTLYLASFETHGEARRAGALRGPLSALDGSAARRAVHALAVGTPADPVRTMEHIDGAVIADEVLLYNERAASAGSLDLRFPFVDQRVVNFCAQVPTRYKIRRFAPKSLVKQAAKGVLPERVINQRKVGFLYPTTGAWLQAEATRAIPDYLLDPAARYGEFLDRSWVEGLVARHAEAPETGEHDLLLSILMLEVWLSSYLPRAMSPEAPARERIEI